MLSRLTQAARSQREAWAWGRDAVRASAPDVHVAWPFWACLYEVDDGAAAAVTERRCAVAGSGLGPGPGRSLLTQAGSRVVAVIFGTVIPVRRQRAVLAALGA